MATQNGYCERKIAIRAAKRRHHPFVTNERECVTKTPEIHLAGEFPMTCYQCHVYENVDYWDDEDY